MLVATVVQIRLAADISPKPPPLFRASRWLHQTWVTILRFCSLHSMKLVVYLMFAAVIHPRPQLIDMPTIVFLAMALAMPRRRITHFILLWTSVSWRTSEL